MNYHEYISETRVTLLKFFPESWGETVGFKIVKGGNYRIKIKLHIRMISGDVGFRVKHTDSSGTESSPTPGGVQFRVIPLTDKDDGKDILTYGETFEYKYDNVEILCIYPVTRANLAANFTIGKGSCIIFTYSWKKDK